MRTLCLVWLCLRLESVQIGKLNRATCDRWSLRPARGQSGREKVRRLETLQGCSILLYSTTSSRKGGNNILDRQRLLGNTVRPCLPVSTPNSLPCKNYTYFCKFPVIFFFCEISVSNKPMDSFLAIHWRSICFYVPTCILFFLLGMGCGPVFRSSVPHTITRASFSNRRLLGWLPIAFLSFLLVDAARPGRDIKFVCDMR